MKKILLGTAISSAILLNGCVVQPARVYVPPPQVYVAPPAPVAAQVEYQPPAPQPVVSVYVEPPLVQPAPVLVAWAPPPMLVDVPPPMPYPGAYWTGGYWAWEGNWVWAHGGWAGPPQPGFAYVNPYYENRGGSVVFVNGFWAAPGVAFVPPPMGISITAGVVGVGVIAGVRPMGPPGVFLPPPPGSHFGMIVPAPVGTAPAVVMSAPPVISAGMRVTAGIGGNVNVVASAGVVAGGQPFNGSIPAQPHLAAALPAQVQAMAPTPASATPIPAYVAGRPPAALPAAQVVHAQVTPQFRSQIQSHSPFPQPVANRVSVPAAPANAPAPTSPGSAAAPAQVGSPKPAAPAAAPAVQQQGNATHPTNEQQPALQQAKPPQQPKVAKPPGQPGNAAKPAAPKKEKPKAEKPLHEHEH